MQKTVSRIAALAIAAGAATSALAMPPATSPARAATIQPAAVTRTASAGTPGIVWAGTLLKAGRVVFSPNRKYALVMQTDGNLVVYRVKGTAWLWGSQTSGNRGAAAVFQKDGNLVVYSRAKHPLWASATKAGAKSFLAMQNDGNLVIYAAPRGRALWSSADALCKLNYGWVLPSGHELYSPNHAYTLAMQTDGNLVVSKGRHALWSSRTDHHPGAFAVYQTDGNFVVYQGRHALWASGTKAGRQSFLMLQNDGNVVVYATPHGPALWSTRT